jgi:hypothetical protein
MMTIVGVQKIMIDYSLILTQIEQSLKSLPEYNNLQDFSTEFYQFWQTLGQLVQQSLVQSLIEQREAKYKYTKKKKKKRYYTPLGEIVLLRRGYSTPKGIKFKVDEELGLPLNKWLPQVSELACALGVSSEFPNAHKLWRQWTSIEITEKTLANQVEKIGNQLQEQEFNNQEITDEIIEEKEKISNCLKVEKIYVGVDGVMTPLNQKQGYKEAKVGVIFWQKYHQKQNKRGIVREREYIATLKSRDEFRCKMVELYQEITSQANPETIVIGDGAHWIWEMAQEQFPKSIEILDFYHLSEYVWKVAKKAYAQCEIKQKEWVNKQQKLLKESSWQTVINNCGKIKRKNQELSLAITNLEGYLNNNKTRVDYKRYLELGLMIGSGVVESSNRRIITQRLKQAGMHWSKTGAEGVMALRAMYLSNSNRWLNFWKLRRINKVS